MQYSDIYNKTLMSITKGKIYKIVNKVNHKIYIGCTINSLEKRFYEHLYRCFKTDYKSKLYNSIKKYGVENFVIELVEECDLDILYETEMKYVQKFDSYNNGLNSTYGGEGCLGYIHTPEIRKKISEGTKNGNSHRGKTYEELYGDRAEEEKNKRKISSVWGKISEEEKTIRINKLKIAIREKSKYGVELIKEVKEKIQTGVSVKELSKIYPQITTSYLYSIKRGERWGDL